MAIDSAGNVYISSIFAGVSRFTPAADGALMFVVVPGHFTSNENLMYGLDVAVFQGVEYIFYSKDLTVFRCHLDGTNEVEVGTLDVSSSYTIKALAVDQGLMSCFEHLLFELLYDYSCMILLAHLSFSP